MRQAGDARRANATLGGRTAINEKKGTKLAMPVVYYSQLMAVAYGSSLKEAGLVGHVIQPERLQKIAERKK
jgi:heterodisulfide reductase subunit B2